MKCLHCGPVIRIKKAAGDHIVALLQANCFEVFRVAGPEHAGSTGAALNREEARLQGKGFSVLFQRGKDINVVNLTGIFIKE